MLRLHPASPARLTLRLLALLLLRLLGRQCRALAVTVLSIIQINIRACASSRLLRILCSGSSGSRAVLLHRRGLLLRWRRLGLACRRRLLRVASCRRLCRCLGCSLCFQGGSCGLLGCSRLLGCRRLLFRLCSCRLLRLLLCCCHCACLLILLVRLRLGGRLLRLPCLLLFLLFASRLLSGTLALWALLQGASRMQAGLIRP